MKKQSWKLSLREMRGFLILSLTQGFSSLGSSMTGYALILWSYQQEGSALTTALLSVCSYAPYVLMSILAGALSDRWNKKRTMLACDTFAAICTATVLTLLRTDQLRIWHLYALNALSGLMNTLQGPAAEVTVSLLTPKKHYQKASAISSFFRSVNTLLTPVAATAIYTLAGLDAVIAIDLFTFLVAFISLALMKIPAVPNASGKGEGVLAQAREGLSWLHSHLGILHLILFLAAINLTASMYSAVLPPRFLPRENGEMALGVINTVTGVTMILGSLAATWWPAPKSRIKIICYTLLLSMGTENLFLSVGKSLPVWCLGSFLGWCAIPLMDANLSTVMRTTIPVEMQGRVYAARNTLQFFTIPLGNLLGGALVDHVFEPWMALQAPDSVWHWLFGQGKGSGAAALLMVMWIMGVATVLLFQRDRHIWALEKGNAKETALS